MLMLTGSVQIIMPLIVRRVFDVKLNLCQNKIVRNTLLLHQLIDPILQMVKEAIAGWGYTGIVIMMAIESANIPLPSEAIMPTAGILVQQHKMNIHLAALSGAIGCLLGSIPSYFLGMFGGRPFLQ